MIFNFRNLILRHSRDNVFAIIETSGYYDYANGGDFIAPERKLIPLIYAAIVPIPEDEITQSDGGYYTHDMKKLYTYTAIDKGTEIQHNNDHYIVAGDKDYSDHDQDLHIYYLQRTNSNETDETTNHITII